MENAEQSDGEHERQLDKIIAEYYCSAETGEAPDQARFIAQYPDFKEELNEFFSDLGVIQQSECCDNEAPGLERTIIDSTTQRKNRTVGAVIRYFGAYEILEELGAGGMGVVYKARHVRLRKLVALKMIRAGEFASDFEVKMFQAEARAAAKLDHPGIVPVHEVGLYAGQHFYSMDYVAGGSLSKLHRDEPVAARRAAELIRQMAEAIHFAHEKGIVHRDLKPANVLLTTTGVPRITDFGLAKRMWANEESVGGRITETGQVMGTAGYMSPEQAEGKTNLVGPPTDIYATGAILYALLTSRAPFVGESEAHIITQVIHNEPISPRALNPSAPRDLETICLKCLTKEPHKRYGTAQLLADDLQRFLEGRSVIARPLSPPARAWRWCSRNPAVAVLSFAILMSLVLGTAISSTLAIRASIAYRKASQLAEEKLELADQERTARQAADAARKAEASQRSTAESLAEANKVLAEIERVARQESERQLRIATAMRLSAQSQLKREKLPVTSLLLAVEAVNVTKNQNEPIIPLAHENLRNALSGVGGKALANHRGGLVTWAASGNGEWLLTAGYEDDTAKLWNLVAPGWSPTVLRGHQSPLVYATFSENAKRLVTLSREGMVRVWDLSGNSTRVLLTERLPALSITAEFSPTGRWLGIQCLDNRVLVYDLVKTTSPVALAGPAHEANADLIVTEDGRWLLAPNHVSPYRGVRVWRLKADSTNEVQPQSLVDGTVYPVTLSPTDRWLAGTLQNDRSVTEFDAPDTIRVWDLNKEDPRLDPVELTAGTNSGWLTRLVFSSDSRVLAVGNGSVAALLSIDGESSAKTLRGQEGTICELAISKDGRRLATGADDQTVRVWDLSSEDPLSTALILRGHKQTISLLQMSPKGRWLVSGDRDNTLCLWDLETPEPEATVRTLAGHEASVRFGYFSQNERWIISGGAGDPVLRLWDTLEEDVTDSIRLPTIGIGQWFDRDIAISPKGRWLVAPGKPARAWDLEAVNPGASIRDLLAFGMAPDPTRLLHHDKPAALSDNWLVTTRRNHQPTLWNLTSREVPPRKLPNDSNYIAISPDENWLAMADKESIRLLNLSCPDPLSAEKRLENHTGPLKALAFSPNSRWLASGSMDNSVRIWDVSRNNSSPCIVSGDAPVSHLGFSPNGKWLLLRFGYGRQCTLQLCNIGKNSIDQLLVRTLRKDESANGSMFKFEFSPDSRWLLTSTIPTLSIRYDPRTTESRNQAAVVELWDLSADDPSHAGVELFKSKYDAASAFSPDGHWLFTFGRGEAKLWDLTAGNLVNSARILEGQLFSGAAAFDPGTRWLVTAGFENAQLWDLSMADFETAPVILSGHDTTVRAVRFTPNGRWLATASDDTTVRLYEMDVNRLITQARSQAGRELSHDEARRLQLPLTAAQQATLSFERLSRGVMLRSELITRIRQESVSDEVRQLLLELAEGFREEPVKASMTGKER